MCMYDAKISFAKFLIIFDRCLEFYMASSSLLDHFT